MSSARMMRPQRIERQKLDRQPAHDGGGLPRGGEHALLLASLKTAGAAEGQADNRA